MVVGIPNVGKSTFINAFAGKACTKTGNKPGVTKGKQWIRLNRSIELLDTPGILWPKFEDQEVGLKLAMIGSMNDEILNREELAVGILHYLLQFKKSAVASRYDLEQEYATDQDALTDIAIHRHCLLKGNVPDTDKAAGMLIDDFRNGKFGRVTLEMPEVTN